MNHDEKNKKAVDLSDAFTKPKLKEEENIKKLDFFSRPENPKIVQWTIKYSGGLVKNIKQANYVILCFVTLMIIISLFLFFNKKTVKVKPLPPEVINTFQPKEGVVPR